MNDSISRLETRSKTTTHLWVGIVALVAAYTVIGLVFARPMIWADSASGFHIWDSMRSGAAWNNYYEIDVTDISRDISIFRTWWSPGQYFFPGLLMLTGLSIGAASVLTASIGTLVGLVGCWRLFKEWGFSAIVINISVVLLALGWQTTFLFGMFNGGEIALFAGFPWIALAAYRLAAKPFWLLIALPPLFLIGAFLKLSFPIIALALSAGIWLGRSEKPAKIDRKAWTLAAVLGVGFVVFYLVLHIIFLSKGPTPADSSGLTFSPARIGYSITGPLLATGAFGSLISRVLLFPGNPVFGSWEDLHWLLCLLSIPAAALYFFVWKKAPNYPYRGMILGMVAGYVAIFIALYSKGAPISMDDRHFRPAGIVLLPGIVHLFYTLRGRWSQILVVGLVVLVGGYGLAGLANRTKFIRNVANVGPRGFTQSNIPASATARLHALDLAAPTTGNRIFYTTSPEMALDYTRVRILQTHSEQENIPDLEKKTYGGRVDDLLVIISRGTTAQKTGIILRSFASYDPDKWQHHNEGGCELYYQGDWLQTELKGVTAPSFALVNPAR